MAWLFVANGWIIPDESANAGSGGDEMNADAAAHAVADDGAALAVDVISTGQITPALVENLHELSVSSFLLSFVDTIGNA